MFKRWWVLGMAMCAAAASTVVAPSRAEAQMSTFVDSHAMPADGQTHSSPQALIGIGLLGAEAVILVEGAVGVRRPLILLGTGALGLIAGGIGGFFVDQAIDSSVLNGGSNVANHSFEPAAATGLLVLGLGLIIPTAIMYVSATMYRPEDTHVETDDNAGSNAPLEESTGTQSGGGAAQPSSGSGGSSDSGSQPAAGGTAPAPASSGAAPAGGGGGGGSRSVRHRIGPEAILNYDARGVHVGIPAIALVPSYSLEEMHQFGVAQQTEWRVPLITASF